MQPIDIAKAVACLGDESVFQLTVEAFLTETDGMMDLLSEAIASGDYSEIREKAHWVKGGLVYLHAEPSAQAAKELEQAAEEQDGAGVQGAYDCLCCEISKLKNALDESGHAHRG